MRVLLTSGHAFVLELGMHMEQIGNPQTLSSRPMFSNEMPVRQQ
jgi:hypothetical protein